MAYTPQTGTVGVGILLKEVKEIEHVLLAMLMVGKQKMYQKLPHNREKTKEERETLKLNQQAGSLGS